MELLYKPTKIIGHGSYAIVIEAKDIHFIEIDMLQLKKIKYIC